MIKEGVICHAEGPRCLGCDHYHGRAPVCVYAPRPEQQVAPTPRTVDERIAAALAMVSDLCQKRRAWTMSVPARPDYDPDLVISGALIVAERELSDERQKYADLSLAYERTDAELSAAKAEAERLREALTVHLSHYSTDGYRIPTDEFMREVVKESRAALAATRKEEGNG